MAGRILATDRRTHDHSELCLATILEYLATEEGDRGRIETLAAWGFQYAQNAYFDTGENGRDYIRLEDIPE